MVDLTHYPHSQAWLRLRVFRTENQCFVHCSPPMHSALDVYDIRPDACSKLPAIFALFPVLSLWVCPCTMKASLPLSTFDGAYVRKNTRLSPPAQLNCSHSRVGEPGNEAKQVVAQDYIYYSYTHCTHNCHHVVQVHISQWSYITRLIPRLYPQEESLGMSLLYHIL